MAVYHRNYKGGSITTTFMSQTFTVVKHISCHSDASNKAQNNVTYSSHTDYWCNKADPTLHSLLFAGS